MRRRRLPMHELAVLLGHLADAPATGHPLRFANGNKAARAASLIASCLAPMRREERILVRGRALVHGFGRLTLTQRTRYIAGPFALARREPACALRSPQGLSGLLDRLGLDASDGAEVIVSANGLLIFFGTVDGTEAVAHLSTRRYRDPLVARHAANLAELRSAPLAGALARSVPSVLSTTVMDCRSAMVQTRLPGVPFRPHGADGALVAARLVEALRPLRQLAGLPPAAESDDAASLCTALRVLPDHFREHGATIETAIAILDGWLARPGRLPVPMHGDYGFHNLLFTEGEVSGIIDWDRMQRRGVAGYDAIHLLMTLLDEMHVCSADEFLVALWLPHLRGPPLKRFLGIVIEHGGCTEIDLPHIGLLIWLQLLLHGGVETPPHNPDWHGRILRRPASALSECDWFVSRAGCAGSSASAGNGTFGHSHGEAR